MRKEWLCTIVLFLVCICVSLQVEAQNNKEKKVTMEFKNERMPSVLKRLEKESGYKILFTYDDVNKFTVTGSVKGATVEQALKIIIGNKPLDYSVEEQFINITLKAQGDKKQKVLPKVVGTVVSEDDGEPVIGASILVKGTKKGAITDINGKFELISVASDDLLVISYIGMEAQTLQPKAIMKVELKSNTQQLGEVVVTGMQKMDKRLFTGASDQLVADDVKMSGMADISRALEGRSAGVSVQNVSGTFGTAPKIRVRGATSIFGSSKPLWVVDGVIMEDVVDIDADALSSGDATTLISSAISGLNAEDIESFNILKDGSATSIYGARAMAGVIVITTRKGRPGVSRINYTGEFTYRTIPNYAEFNIMNSQDQMSVYRDMQKKGWLNLAEVANDSESGVYGKMYQLVSSGLLKNDDNTLNNYLREAEYRNTNWFEHLFNNNIMSTHSVSLTSGTEKSSYYASLSAMYDPGWTKASKVERYTANLNAMYKLYKNVSLNLIGNASYRTQKAPGTLSQTTDAVSGTVRRDFDINPYSYCLNASRTLDPNAYYIRNYAPFNIIHELDANYMDLSVVDTKFQGELKWTVVKGLELSLLGAVKYQATSQEHHITDASNQAIAYRTTEPTYVRDHNPFLYTDPDNPYAEPISVLPVGGIYERTDYKMLSYDFRLTGAYSTTINQTHIINLYGGMELNKNDRHNTWSRGWGLQYEMGFTPFYDYQVFKKGQEQGSKYYTLGNTYYRNIASFFNGTYSYKGKYTLNGTFRYEGTNKMGKSRNARWLPTWNVSGAWNAHEESFFKEVSSVLSHLSLKASYSLTADRGPASVTNSLAVINAYNPWRPTSGVSESGLNITALENSELTYEKKHELNLGVDMGFLNNRVNLVLDWYKRNNFDLIGDVTTQGIGGTIIKKGNIAEMKSSGIEISLSTKNIKTKDFSWTTDFIYSHIHNRVTKLETSKRVIDLISGSGFTMEGYPVRSLFSLSFEGLNEIGLPQVRNEKGEITTYDINFQERERFGHLIYEGSIDPTDLGSFGNIFQYKNLKLNVFMTYSFGNFVRLDPYFSGSYSDLDAMPREFKNRWMIPGDENYTDVPAILSRRQKNLNSSLPYAYSAYNYSTARVAKGDFIRMKEISVSYDFPKKLISSLKFESLSLKLQGTNLFLIYADKKLNGQDPEFANSGGVATPVPRQFTLTVRVGL